MSTLKHTPGPWHQSPCFMIEAANGDYICKIDASEGDDHHANAKAIAALPDLLEALRECITEDPGAPCFNTGRKTRRLEAITKIAREALAKATL